MSITGLWSTRTTSILQQKCARSPRPAERLIPRIITKPLCRSGKGAFIFCPNIGMKRPLFLSHDSHRCLSLPIRKIPLAVFCHSPCRAVFCSSNAPLNASFEVCRVWMIQSEMPRGIGLKFSLLVLTRAWEGQYSLSSATLLSVVCS